jgi:hypothetical protein
METVKDKDKNEWHIGCGGEVLRGRCVKCGKRKKGLVERIFGEGPFIIKEDKSNENQKISKKLSIKRETVSNLDNAVLEMVKGGLVTRNYSQCGEGYATLVPCLCE